MTIHKISSKTLMYFKILCMWPNLEELLLGVEEKAAPGPSTMPCGRHIMPCREDEKSNSIFDNWKDHFVMINFTVDKRSLQTIDASK